MLHFGLSTGKQRVEDFTGSSICAGTTPATNCVDTKRAMPRVASAETPVLRPAVQPVRKTVTRRRQVIILGGMGEM